MKRVFTLLLALMMVVGCITMLPLSVGAEDDETPVSRPWTGDKTTPEGSGTKDDPYIVDYAGDLYWFSTNNNPGDQYIQSIGFNGAKWRATYIEYDASGAKRVNAYSLLQAPYIYVKQVCDIDLGGRNMNPPDGYWSVRGQGDSEVKGQFFRGEYDGQGFAIKNGAFTRSNANTRWIMGMFGAIFGATIKNIRFENIDATGAAGSGDKGIVAAKAIGPADFAKRESQDFNGNRDKIDNEFYTVCANAPRNVIENIYVSGSCNVNGTSGNVVTSLGGLVGTANYTDFKNCVSAAKITMNKDSTYVGGIVGIIVQDTTVDNCHYIGHIVGTNTHKAETHIGGIVGSWKTIWGDRAALQKGRGAGNEHPGNSAITNCMNFGTLTGNSGGTTCVGGILGGTASLYTYGTDATYTIKNNYQVGAEWGGGTRVGAIVGCFYTNGTNAAPWQPVVEYDRNAAYNQVVVEDCHAQLRGAVAPGGYDNLGNMIITRNWGTSSAKLVNCKYYQDSHLFLNPDVQAKIAEISQVVYKASGSEIDPYQVYDVTGITWMQRAMGNGAAGELMLYKAWDNKYFEQTNDIDCGGIELQPIGFYYAESTNWSGTLNNWHYDPTTGELVAGRKYTEVLKKAGVVFSGNYNGNSFAIKNANVIQGSSANTNWGVGLFGVIHGATLKNIVLDKVNVTGGGCLGFIVGMAQCDRMRYDLTNYKYNVDTSTTPPTVTDEGLVSTPSMTYEGYNVIENCVVNPNCTATYSVDANWGAIGMGGIAGLAYGTTISNCYTSGTLTNSKEVYNVGGIAGVVGLANKITNCISAGNINYVLTSDCNSQGTIGGLFGCISGVDHQAGHDTYFVAENCVNKGDINVSGTTKPNNFLVGGLVGGTEDLRPTKYGYKMIKCYNVGDFNVAEDVTFGACQHFGSFVGQAFISGGNNGAAGSSLQLINCASSLSNDLCASMSGGYQIYEFGGVKMVGRADRAFADNVALAVVTNTNGSTAISDSGEALADLQERVAVIEGIYTDAKGIKNYGVQSSVNSRGMITLRFLNIIDHKYALKDIKAINYSIVVSGDAERTLAPTADMVYTSYVDQTMGKISAPEGYKYMTDVTVANLKSDGTYQVTMSITFITTDGRVNQMPVVVNVVNGVISYK